jgi:hypothetical protein
MFNCKNFLLSSMSYNFCSRGMIANLGGGVYNSQIFLSWLTQLTVLPIDNNTATD